MSGKVVTFGEIMLRLSTVSHRRILQANGFEATYAGGEANVAVSLARLGLESRYITKLPCNLLGEGAICLLRGYGVDTNFISRGGERIGIYFIEHGASQRASRIIYDRARSAIAEASPHDFNWDDIFKDALWFHFSGITPALGKKAAEITREALAAARRKNITISCDLNFRKNLWSPEEANRVMSELMHYVDICIGNEEDAFCTFGIKSDGSDITKGVLNDNSYQKTAEMLMDKFKFKIVATSLRESYSASLNGWSGMVYDGNRIYKSRHYDIHIVDRVGSGDAFAAGLIYSILKGSDMQDCVNFAAAASCLKHSIPGDFNLVTFQEVESLKEGDASGRVQR